MTPDTLHGTTHTERVPANGVLFVTLRLSDRMLLYMFLLCVPCYLSEWKASLSHEKGCFFGCLPDQAESKYFLAVSWSQYAWKVFEECEIQDKINVCLSGTPLLVLLLLPHICPLLLTPPQLRGTTLPSTSAELEMRAPHALVGVDAGWVWGYILLGSWLRHAQRHLTVNTTSAARSCSVRVGSVKPSYASCIRLKTNFILML